MKIKMIAEFRTEDGSAMSASDMGGYTIALQEMGCPVSALPQPITRDIGSQRDPQYLTVGMRTEWETDTN